MTKYFTWKNFGRMFAIIIIICILYIMFFGRMDVFLITGATGGCVFLIKFIMETSFPESFKEKKKKKKKNETRKI